MNGFFHSFKGIKGDLGVILGLLSYAAFLKRTLVPEH
jgi:hypothetical protein